MREPSGCAPAYKEEVSSVNCKKAHQLREAKETDKPEMVNSLHETLPVWPDLAAEAAATAGQ